MLRARRQHGTWVYAIAYDARRRGDGLPKPERDQRVRI